jgi:hypothetical protein
MILKMYFKHYSIKKFQRLLKTVEISFMMLKKLVWKVASLIKNIEERRAGDTEFCESEVFLEEFIPAYELTLDRL